MLPTTITLRVKGRISSHQLNLIEISAFTPKDGDTCGDFTQPLFHFRRDHKLALTQQLSYDNTVALLVAQEQQNRACSLQHVVRPLVYLCWVDQGRCGLDRHGRQVIPRHFGVTAAGWAAVGGERSIMARVRRTLWQMCSALLTSSFPSVLSPSSCSAYILRPIVYDGLWVHVVVQEKCNIVKDDLLQLLIISFEWTIVCGLVCLLEMCDCYHLIQSS